MNKLLFFLTISLLMTSCFGGGSKSNDNNEKSDKQTAAIIPSIPRLAELQPWQGAEVKDYHPDLDIKVVGCTNNNGVIKVDLIITNYGRDEEITVYPEKFVAFDDAGYTYQFHRVYGSANFTFASSLSSVSTGRFFAILPKDIPQRFSFHISKLNPTASKILRVELSIDSWGTIDFDSEKPVIIKNLTPSKG